MSQKKTKAKSIRNVLVTPFSIHWSENNPEDVTSLRKALEELLPLAKLEKKSLKLHSKGETDVEAQTDTSVKKHNNIFRTYLAPGFQSVVRGLEKKELCCVLLSSDISPPMIQRVVCSYCSTHDVPLIIVPDLKTITKSTLGFPSMVLGLKKIAESPENKFFPIYEIVSRNPCIFDNPFTAKRKEETTIEKEDNSILSNKISSLSPVKRKNCYLYREGKNVRVFRPGSLNSTGTSQIKLPPKDGMDEDFISFIKVESKSSVDRDLSKQISKTSGKSYIEDDDDESDCDSIDEDNAFFVDNNPDHMLLEVDPLKNEENSTKTGAEFERLDEKSLGSKKTKNKKAKALNERYFMSKVKQDVKPKKILKKEKNVHKQKAQNYPKIEKNTTKFNSLTIKTTIGNPKKIKKKNK